MCLVVEVSQVGGLDWGIEAVNAKCRLFSVVPSFYGSLQVAGRLHVRVRVVLKQRNLSKARRARITRSGKGT